MENPRRNRCPLGLVPRSPYLGTVGRPALFDICDGHRMHTVQRSVNHFLPDSQMLFHVLGICDQMMNYTHHFLRSSPAWLPLVSQLYIAVLWNVMILRVYVDSRHGFMFHDTLHQLVSSLQITECMIPGPLIPFFQALAAVNGPFDWIGDIVPAMPDFASIWDAKNFCSTSNACRFLPIPAIIFDQLYHFATHPIPAGQTSAYTTFEWYRNIFGVTNANVPIRNRLGPQLCGSCFTTQAQFDAARNFWNSAIGISFTRITTTGAALNSHLQLFGFLNQINGPQTSWFQDVAIVMEKYALYFNGSAPLKSILTTGIGAVVVHGTPDNNTETRNWFYPAASDVAAFTTTRLAPRREIPSELSVTFSHADHKAEELAEQYAIVTHTNIQWSTNLIAQNNLDAVDGRVLHQGDYWRLRSHRITPPVSLKIQFTTMIASRYHYDGDSSD